jgi:hypothetical protein
MIALTLVVGGGLLMMLATETVGGLALVALGVAVELVGIGLERHP